jgi:hypothetical protein
MNGYYNDMTAKVDDNYTYTMHYLHCRIAPITYSLKRDYIFVLLMSTEYIWHRGWFHVRRRSLRPRPAASISPPVYLPKPTGT